MSEQIRETRVQRRIAAIVGALLLTTGCASSGGTPPPADAVYGTAAVANHGPKKTIAVARFDANGAFVARYGGWDIGGGLAAQLTSELQRSNRFVVVERAELGGVLREQEMALTGLTTTQTSPGAGQLLGAQLLVRGSVTEFSESDSGNGLTFGGPVGAGFGTALSSRSRKGSVAIDVRVIDTTTGRVVASTTTRRELESRAIGINGMGQAGMRVGYDMFDSSPLGEATRDAIAETVVRLSSMLSNVPWNAQVAKVAAGKVYVNAGSNASLSEGTSLDVYRVVGRVVDPYTGELLGFEERRIGSVTIGAVRPRYSTGSFDGGVRPQVGDMLRYAPRVASQPATSPTQGS